MSKKPKGATPHAKRWICHFILSDTPLSKDDCFLGEADLKDFISRIQLYPGLRISGLRLTPLPERAKVAKTAENEAKAAESRTLGLTKALAPDILKGVSRKAEGQ